MSAYRLRGLALDIVLWVNGQGAWLRAGEEHLTLARQATLGEPIQPQRCPELTRHCFQKMESTRATVFILRIFTRFSHMQRVIVTTGVQSPVSGLHSGLIFVVAAAVLVWLFVVVFSLVRKDMVIEKKTQVPNKYTCKMLNQVVIFIGIKRTFSSGWSLE